MTDADELIAILRDWPYMGETYAGEAADMLEVLAARLAEVEAERDKMLTALIWCSGSDDFQDGGEARKGWLKLCAPLIHKVKP